MIIKINAALIRRSKRYGRDPVELAVEEQAGAGWHITYDFSAYGIGENRKEYETPEELRTWMAIWDSGGNEGVIEFELMTEQEGTQP